MTSSSSDLMRYEMLGGELSPTALTERETERVAEADRRQNAENTLRSYRAQWKLWSEWAERRGTSALPAQPDMLRAYFTERASDGVSRSTLRVAAAAVAFVHVKDGRTSPISESVKGTLKGLSDRAGREQKQVEGLTAEGMAAVRATACQARRGRGGRLETEAEARLRGTTDIAVLALMRDALLRIGEAVVLTWADLERWDGGVGRLTIRRSKTDREGRGAVVYVSGQTMRDIDAMAACRGDLGERIFPMSERQMRNRIKRACAEAGLGEGFSGHSARIGMARDLVRFGTELTELMNAGRWKSHRMPAHYTRNEEAGRGAVARYYGAA